MTLPIVVLSTYVDNAKLYFQCDQAADLYQQLEFTSALESDIRDTRKTSRWKPRPTFSVRLNKSGAIDVKIEWDSKNNYSHFEVSFSWSCASSL